MSEQFQFPSGKKRKDEMAKVEKSTSWLATSGKNKVVEIYHWLDSPLDFTNEGGVAFLETFRPLIPEGYNLREYIEEILKDKKGKAVGVEFGGVGVNLFQGFTPHFFEQSVGITLVDHRSKEEKAGAQSIQEFIHHQVLEGDILKEETYKELKEKLQNKKIDLILSRMARGLELMPEEPYALSRVLQRWYETLNAEGVMFVQFPVAFNRLVEAWAEKIKKDYGQLLEVKCILGEYDSTAYNISAFRLIKRIGAPEKMPVLNPRTVRNTKKFDSFLWD